MLKKEKLIMFILVCIMAVSTMACSSSDSGNIQTKSVDDIETSSPATEAPGNNLITHDGEQLETPDVELKEKEESDSDYYIDKYSKILDKYYEALSERWDGEKLMSEDLSILCTYCYEKNALENVGYTLMDLNSDGEYELVIGAISGDEFIDKMIFDIYALVEGVPTQIVSGQERDNYYICEEEAGSYIIANCGSMGATQSVWGYSTFDGRKLTVTQEILYDAAADAANPWFMTDNTDRNVGKNTPVSEETAQSIIDNYRVQYILPEYFAFEDYKQ